MLNAWLKAFALTIVIECPIDAALFRKDEPKLLRRLGLAFFANLATHPSVWFVFPAIPIDPWTTFVLSELFAWLAEAAFFALAFRGTTWKRALLVALIANAISLGIGLVLYRAIGGWMLS